MVMVNFIISPENFHLSFTCSNLCTGSTCKIPLVYYYLDHSLQTIHVYSINADFHNNTNLIYSIPFNKVYLELVFNENLEIY